MVRAIKAKIKAVAMVFLIIYLLLEYDHRLNLQ